MGYVGRKSIKAKPLSNGIMSGYRLSFSCGLTIIGELQYTKGSMRLRGLDFGSREKINKFEAGEAKV